MASYHLASFYDRLYQTMYLKSQSPDDQKSLRMLQVDEKRLQKLKEALEEPSKQAILKNPHHPNKSIQSGYMHL